MRANPLVCVQLDEVESPQRWKSVVAYGRYEELPDTPEYSHKRQLACSLLQRHPVSWEPGYVKKSWSERSARSSRYTLGFKLNG
jgi:nitroimidazol reductase NimA-like FMN-containing flavoprotein (pyridoxamine 5'-phosphate oxidase superfamily)